MNSDRIEQRVYLEARPERVWRALTDASEFASWFGVGLDGRIVAGTRLHMTWEDQRFAVDIVELAPPSRLVWRWHPGMVDAAVDYSKEPQTTTVFSLVPHGSGTMLTVVESGFGAIAAARRPVVFKDNVNGWLEQAVALRNYLKDAG